jgi:DNA-binding response OmpR family regulator
MTTAQQARTIMLVEDDPTVALSLAAALEAGGYRIWQADNGADARALLEHGHPDLIILDLLLPDVDGLVLCPGLKAMAADVPIIICSGTPHRRDAVLGLKLGADDFIAKPFDVYELLARVEAVLRRTSGSPAASHPAAPVANDANVRQAGPLMIDRTRVRVTVGGQELQLTPTQYRLLNALADRPEGVVTRAELARLVWGIPEPGKGRAIDAHIDRLRRRLATGAEPGVTIEAVPGFGYQLHVTPRAR